MFDPCRDVEVQEGQAGINVGSVRIRTADGTDSYQVRPRLGPCVRVSRVSKLQQIAEISRRILVLSWTALSLSFIYICIYVCELRGRGW